MLLLGQKLDKYNGQRSALIKKRREYMSETKVEACQKLHPKRILKKILRLKYLYNYDMHLREKQANQ